VSSGERYANGVTVTSNSLTAVSGYVQQDDLFIGTLTVRETLTFQGRNSPISKNYS
jgi:ABC-type multidrug transport system ATPase subunit